MKNNPLVSIIMPLYNCEALILDAIESVINQTYKNWELIIVDDMSLDNSFLVVKKYIINEPRIQLYQMSQNSGVSASRNYAIELAKGRYISFLDSDDVWLPKKLEKQIKFLEKHNLVLTYSAYHTIDENSKYINTRSVPSAITYEDMLKSNHIGNLTGIYDVDFFGKVYMEDVGHEDYVLWLKLLKQVPYTKGLLSPLATYRVLVTSISSNKLKTLKWQWYIYREVEKLNVFKSAYYFIFYVYYALKKRSLRKKSSHI